MDPPTDKSSTATTKPPWRQKIKREMVDYLITALYLAIFFGAFTWYRRFILAAYDITYFEYGTAIIEALILAKVVWLGEVLRLVRDRPDEPLLYPTIKRAIIFTIFVGLFAISEHMVRDRLKGLSIPASFTRLFGEDKYELIARCFVIFCAFIPFFAFRELAKRLGPGKLWQMFFQKGEPGDVGAPA